MRWCILIPWLAACDGGSLTVPVDTSAATLAPPPRDCSAVEHLDDVYDCDQLDRCDRSETNLPHWDACCGCDPALCSDDPTCPTD